MIRSVKKLSKTLSGGQVRPPVEVEKITKVPTRGHRIRHRTDPPICLAETPVGRILFGEGRILFCQGNNLTFKHICAEIRKLKQIKRFSLRFKTFRFGF